MAETSDYVVGNWAGHSFTDARKAYDTSAGRSYADAVTSGKTVADLVAPFVETQSEHPVVILCDVTGSMGEWPATIFSKLPYLDLEGKEYLGQDMEICFGAVGDAHSDKYPFQVRPFSKGTDLTKELKALVVEGNGGGQAAESYELAALYCARNVRTPKALKPIVIFIGDEALYEYVSTAHAKMVHVDTVNRIDTKSIFEELTTKFSVYIIRKPYNMSDEARIHAQWTELVGADHVAMLQHPDRVVDVIFGIFAKETSRIDYFKAEIEGRQRPDQVDTVYKSLNTIHGLPVATKGPKGKSVMAALPKGKKTKSLLP